MTLWAVLGDIEFEQLTAPTGMEGKLGTDYAEQPRTEGKPTLQWIGDKLSEFTIKLRFHHMYCDPKVQLRQLREAMSAHRPLAWIAGSGDYRGVFVITDIGMIAGHTAPDSTLRLVDVTLTIKEYAGEITRKPSTPALKRSGEPLPPRALSLAAAATRSNVLIGRTVSIHIPPQPVTASLILPTALAALSAARKAASAVAAWRRGDVAGALGAAGGLADQALKALGIQSDFLWQSGFAGLATHGMALYTAAKNGRNLLHGVTLANLPERIGAMGTVLTDIDTQVTAVTPTVNRLAADVATRRIV